MPWEDTLFEWNVADVPCGVMVLLVLPDWSREVPSQTKTFTHTFRVLGDDHFKRLLDVILYIDDMFIEHTAVILPHGSPVLRD